MKLSASVGIGILSLLLGPAALLAQDEPKPEPKPEPKQEEVKPPNQEKPTPESTRQDEMKPPKQDETKPSKQEKQEQKQEEKQPQSNEQMRTSQQTNHAQPAGKSAHIPDEKFRASFGRSHTFVVQRTTVVGGQPGFAYGGFSFIFVDPWPAGWAYTDDCYVDYVNGEYILFDLAHPGVSLVLTVVL